jgi:copper transport protein
VLLRTRVPVARRHAPARLALGFVAIVLTLLGLLAGPPSAAAQDSETENSLSSSSPADGDTLGASPAAITFTFTREVGPDDVLTAPVSCGNPAALQQVDVPTRNDDDERIVSATVLAPFPRGACTVPWSLRDAEGLQITSGLITFSVQADPTTTEGTAAGDTTATTVAATPAPAASAGDDDEGSTGGALWLGRVLSTVGILVVFGAIVLIGVAWPEGPEYVITVRFLRSMWALSLLGTLLFVVAFTAESSGRSFGASLSPGTWLDLADAGTPGRAALARLLLVVLTGWVVMRPERVIDPTTQLAAYLLPGLAVVTVGLSRTGGDLEFIGILMGIAHALASALWVGGAVLVARVVLAGPGDDDLVHAVRGFNRLSGPAILVTIGTGVVQMLRLDGGSLFSSDHGRVLLLKTVAVAAMVFVAMTTRQMVAARLDRANEMTAPLADRFRRAFSAEAAIGVIVLGLSGWLLAITPARIEAAEQVDYAITRPFVDEATGFDVDVSVTPAQVGLNGIKVEVNAPAEGVSNLVVTFIPPEGSGARGIEQPIPLTGAGTATLDADQGIPLDAAGTWTLQLSGVTASGTLTGAVSSFPVTAGDDAATTGTSVPAESSGSAPDSTDGSTIITVIVDPALTTTTTTGD